MTLWVLHQACLGVAKVSTLIFLDLDIIDARIPTLHQSCFVVCLCKHVISRDIFLLFPLHSPLSDTSIKNYLSHQTPTARFHATYTIALARHAIHTQTVPRFDSHERPTAPSSGNSLAPSSISWLGRPLLLHALGGIHLGCATCCLACRQVRLCADPECSMPLLLFGPVLFMCVCKIVGRGESGWRSALLINQIARERETYTDTTPLHTFSFAVSNVKGGKGGRASLLPPLLLKERALVFVTGTT